MHAKRVTVPVSVNSGPHWLLRRTTHRRTTKNGSAYSGVVPSCAMDASMVSWKCPAPSVITTSRSAASPPFRTSASAASTPTLASSSSPAMDCGTRCLPRRRLASQLTRGNAKEAAATGWSAQVVDWRRRPCAVCAETT